MAATVTKACKTWLKRLADGKRTVGVFKEGDQVSLGRLLQGHDGARLESEVGLEVLGDFTDETLEGELIEEDDMKRGSRDRRFD